MIYDLPSASFDYKTEIITCVIYFNYIDDLL